MSGVDGRLVTEDRVIVGVQGVQGHAHQRRPRHRVGGERGVDGHVTCRYGPTDRRRMPRGIVSLLRSTASGRREPGDGVLDGIKGAG
jgi:hypothetical protein